jgi:cytochrome c
MAGRLVPTLEAFGDGPEWRPHPAGIDLVAAQALALAGQRQCLGCHQVDARRVGPPFRAIAERFQGRHEAAGHLVRAMREGSRGQWGAIPMPAQTRLSDVDAQRLALWILSLRDTHAAD